MFANVTDDGESSGINFNVAATAALKTSFNVARASERAQEPPPPTPLSCWNNNLYVIPIPTNQTEAK